MEGEDIFTQISRNLARDFFPDTYRGRTLSEMTADFFGTNTNVVHVVGFGIFLGMIASSKK